MTKNINSILAELPEYFDLTGRILLRHLFFQFESMCWKLTWGLLHISRLVRVVCFHNNELVND